MVQVPGRRSYLTVYVSTSCLKGGRDLGRILDLYRQCGIRNIELGSSHSYVPDIEGLLRKHADGNFIVHNYFPPPRVPFKMNLAAQDEKIRSSSVEVCQKAIDLCQRFRYHLYSFHPGFRVQAGLAFDFALSGSTVPYEKSFRRFSLSLQEISAYARKARVGIALENLEHKHEAYMMTRPVEFERILKMFPDMGVLVDLGHLKIASRKLGFDMGDFLEVVRHNVAAVHIHDNDGRSDQHLPPVGTELFKFLNYLHCDKIILECRDLSLDRIVKGLEDLEEVAE